MSSNITGQPLLVRDQEAESELVIGEVHGIEAPVDHGHALEGHLGQSIGHVQIVQDAVNVAGFHEDEPAVVLGAVWVTRVCVELQDGHDEGLDGGVEGVVAELLNVGDAFECFHGGSPFDGHKKARRSRRKGGRDGEPGWGLSQGWSGLVLWERQQSGNRRPSDMQIKGFLHLGRWLVFCLVLL